MTGDIEGRLVDPSADPLVGHRTKITLAICRHCGLAITRARVEPSKTAGFVGTGWTEWQHIVLTGEACEESPGPQNRGPGDRAPR